MDLPEKNKNENNICEPVKKLEKKNSMTKKIEELKEIGKENINEVIIIKNRNNDLNKILTGKKV